MWILTNIRGMTLLCCHLTELFTCVITVLINPWRNKASISHFRQQRPMIDRRAPLWTELRIAGLQLLSSPKMSGRQRLQGYCGLWCHAVFAWFVWSVVNTPHRTRLAEESDILVPLWRRSGVGKNAYVEHSSTRNMCTPGMLGIMKYWPNYIILTQLHAHYHICI